MTINPSEHEAELIAEDERQWEERFAATSDEQFVRLEQKIRESIARQGTKPLDFTEWENSDAETG